ncbi:hypothetical protein F5878DRAFT_277430, partial [Lentinula raphanica]
MSLSQNLAPRTLRSKVLQKATSPDPLSPSSSTDQEHPSSNNSEELQPTSTDEPNLSNSTSTPDLPGTPENLDTTQSPTLGTPEVLDTPRSPASDILPTPLSPTSDISDSDSDDATTMSSIRTNASGRVEFGNGKNLGPRVVDRANYDVFDHGDLHRAIEKHAKLTKQTDLNTCSSKESLKHTVKFTVVYCI